MDPKKSWTPPLNVGELFVRYWRWAAAWSPTERLSASLKNEEFDAYVRHALSKEEEVDVLGALQKVIPRHDEAVSRPQILALLQRIDDVFLLIHPRSLSASGEIRIDRVPTWLRRYREIRNTDGIYAKNDEFCLLPRGPLCRSPRDEFASHAEAISDRFSALTVYAASMQHQQMQLSIKHLVVSLSAVDGVSPVKRRGHEKIVSVPMMEAEDDLHLHLSEVGGREYVSYSLSPTVDAVDRLSRAAKSGAGGDLLLAPEFAVDATAADAITKHLQNTPGLGYGLIAAGTGDATGPAGEPPFNEMRLLNGLGVPLWRQRKIWPAFISDDVARQLGLEPKTKQLYEASSSCRSLTIADVDALGRVMVLICQDFKMPAAATLIEELQPDWVIVPVMDTGVSPARWSHQRAFELSEITQSRFLICSGLSMALRMELSEPIPCLSAIGPKVPSDASDLHRAFIAEAARGAAGERYAELTWRTSGWQQTILETRGATKV